MKIQNLILGAATAALVFGASAAQAATVVWAQWDLGATTGATAGSATASNIGVTYTGEVENLFYGYPSWAPASTFSGGSVSNTPDPSNGIIQLFGGGTNTDTITFATAVLDPVIAIWSLGSQPPNANAPASLNFDLPFTIVAGGPSAEYQGQSITISGTDADGAEGNGVVRFNGLVSSITFTTPSYENWYGFTVGEGAVPEPATWAMFLVGFGSIGFMMRRRLRNIIVPFS